MLKHYISHELYLCTTDDVLSIIVLYRRLTGWCKKIDIKSDIRYCYNIVAEKVKMKSDLLIVVKMYTHFNAKATCGLDIHHPLFMPLH